MRRGFQRPAHGLQDASEGIHDEHQLFLFIGIRVEQLQFAALVFLVDALVLDEYLVGE